MNFNLSNLKNLRNLRNRTKDRIFKGFCLGVLATVWVIIALLLMNYRAAAMAAEDTSFVAGAVEDVSEAVELDEIVPDEIVPDEEDEPGKDHISYGLSDGVDDIVKAGEAFGDFVEDVVDVFVNGIDESEQQTEVQAEAVVETEALIESESEQETEVLIQLTALKDQIASYPYDYDWAVALAQLMWAEARGCSKREQSMIAWTVLNRLDAHYDGMSDFWSILTAPWQFAYYSGNPYEGYELDIAIDVLQNWAAEKDGLPSNRTLPQGYLYYYGDGAHNYFSTNGSGGELYFGLGDPYEATE